MSTAICIPPITITDAMITSSTAFEVSPTAYNSGTTYALGAFASVAGAAGLIAVYKSIQAGNLNNTPASSPLWWVVLCYTYQEYSGAATYASGDYVIDAAAHLVYQSLVSSNTGNALSDETKWSRIGPTNKWAMFDLDRNSGTTQTGPLTVVIEPDQRIDSIGLFGVVGSEATITMTVSAVDVYTKTISMTGRNTLTWSDYFFGMFRQVPSLLLTDLPPYANATITVTIEGVTASCGALVVGSYVEMGNTQYGASNDGENFSRIERDEFGNSTLVRRRTIPRIQALIVCKKSNTNRLRELRVDTNAEPAVWSLLGSDDTDDYFESLLILGVYRKFLINVDHPQHTVVEFEAEEI